LLELFVIIIIIGFGAGVLGSLIGVGGGIIITPALTYMNFPPSVIASSSLLAVFATSISSTLTYARKKYVDYLLGIKLALPAIPGAIIGSFFTDLVILENFKIYFAFLLMSVGIYIFIKNKILSTTIGTIPKPFLHIIIIFGNFSAGVISSFFGVGGGVIFVPILIVIYNMEMINASPTSQFTLLLSTITGLITHVMLEHPEYSYGIILAIGSFLGAQIGSRSIHRINENILSKIFSVSLILIAINLILDYFKKFS
jgi:uncharacterized membrane protein YfcA